METIMKNLAIFLISGLFGMSLAGQEKTFNEEESITVQELRDHMFYLASDELEGRLTGTPGYDKAVQYAATQLRQAGLLPICRIDDSTFSYYQDFSLEKFTPDLNSTINIQKARYSSLKRII
jgi:hypothetical protein